MSEAAEAWCGVDGSSAACEESSGAFVARARPMR